MEKRTQADKPKPKPQPKPEPKVEKMDVDLTPEQAEVFLKYS